jgi:16S rRNA (guanine(966)-N(2))-methyltransferase RsmD
VADLPGLRPTPDRVRQTLFDWLSHLLGGDCQGLRVLDACAGTGALGLEAASRGARWVDLLEPQAIARRNLLQIVARLGAEQTLHVHADRAEQWLSRPSGLPYDLIFLDPPFGQRWLERLLPLAAHRLAPGGLVYAEAEFRLAPEGWEVLRHLKAGAVHAQLLAVAPSPQSIAAMQDITA